MTVEPAVFLWNYGWLRNTPFDICFSFFLALLFILFLLLANKLYQNVNNNNKNGARKAVYLYVEEYILTPTSYYKQKLIQDG